MQFVYLAVGGNQVILHENSKILQSFETIESLFTFKCLLLQNIEQKSIDKSNLRLKHKKSVGRTKIIVHSYRQKVRKLESN